MTSLMNKNDKKLLIIAYAFPPHSVVGSMRPLRMAKYLEKAAGWRPVVLTVSKEFKRNDYSLLEEVPPEVKIYRSWTVEPAIRLANIRSKLFPITPKIDNDPGLFDSKRRNLLPGFLKKSLSKTLSLLSEALSVPDEQVFWNLPVIMQGMKIITKERVDAILITSPPWSLQIAGFLLKKMTGVPWVVDFRDPWTDIKRKNRPAFIDTFEQRIEKGLLAEADLVLSTSDMYSNDLIRKYPEIEEQKFQTLHNGYDEEKFDHPKPVSGHSKFTIAHLGTMYSLFNPYAFFEALREWLAMNPEIEDKIELLFVGEVNEETRKAMHECNVSHLTTVTGFVPHKEAIELCSRADMLLLAMGTDDKLPRGWLPSKLFEYLALDRPILAYVSEGEASDMVRKVNQGCVVTGQDHNQIIDFMNELYVSKWRHENLYVPWENDSECKQRIQQPYLMKKLGTLLDGIAS